jgi:hypothetical protein
MANVTIRNLNKNYENGFHAVKPIFDSLILKALVIQSVGSAAGV